MLPYMTAHITVTMAGESRAFTGVVTAINADQHSEMVNDVDRKLVPTDRDYSIQVRIDRDYQNAAAIEAVFDAVFHRPMKITIPPPEPACPPDEVDQLRALLRDLEWSGNYPPGSQMCPSCCGEPHEGHTPECKLAALLPRVTA